jgi:hypothetical protein
MVIHYPTTFAPLSTNLIVLSCAEAGMSPVFGLDPAWGRV